MITPPPSSHSNECRHTFPITLTLPPVTFLFPELKKKCSLKPNMRPGRLWFLLLRSTRNIDLPHGLQKEYKKFPRRRHECIDVGGEYFGKRNKKTFRQMLKSFKNMQNVRIFSVLPSYTWYTCPFKTKSVLTKFARTKIRSIMLYDKSLSHCLQKKTIKIFCFWPALTLYANKHVVLVRWEMSAVFSFFAFIIHIIRFFIQKPLHMEVYRP